MLQAAKCQGLCGSGGRSNPGRYPVCRRFVCD